MPTKLHSQANSKIQQLNCKAAVLSFFVLSAPFLLVSSANAYLQYAPNDHVAEEVSEHPFRILPHSDHYAFAIDSDFFKPIFTGGDNSNYYRYDYYHGNGYWMSIRAEFKPVSKATINLKLNLTHGSSSNGPTYLAEVIPMAGFTYEESLLGFDITTRLSDIGRQTVGIGLFIEDKETDGGYIMFKRDEFVGKVMVDGTGSYRLDGGVIATDVSFWKGLVGGVLFVQETETPFHPPALMATLYSKHEWPSGIGYGAEMGIDINSWAGMAFVKYEDTWNHFHFWLKPQARYYGPRILGDLPGKVSQNYISYDQNDKPFTNIMDIFPFGDNVVTLSSQLNAEYVFNSFYRIYAETEAVNYQYKGKGKIQELFYRSGIKFFPFKSREDNFGFLVGNKYLIASTAVSPDSSSRTYSLPNMVDFENKPLFMNQLYFMINFQSKF